MLSAAIVVAIALFASCGGDGPEKIAGPVTDGTTSPPGTGATPPNGGTTTPPTGTTPPADTSATTPPAGTTPPTTGGTTPPDTSAATPPGTAGTTPPSTGGTTGTVTAVAIVPSSLTLALGDTLTIAATLTTTGAAPTGGWIVTWESTDASVVAVTPTGKLSARAVGTAAIKATAGGRSATLVVTVSAQPFVRSVVLSPTTATMMLGDQVTFTATVGADAAPAGGWPVTWSSEFRDVASVSASGVVTALTPGSTTITAWAGNGAGRAGVTVVSGPTVTGIALSPATLYVGLGATASFNPALTTIGTAPAGGWPITWTSASPAIATVNAAGVVTGVAPGSTTITATSGTKTASATVAVATADGGTASVVSAVTISPFSKVWLAVGNKKTLGASVAANGPPPENGWPLVWTSTDPGIATVAANGVVSAISPGVVTITAAVGGVSATREVEVLPQPGVVNVAINVTTDGFYVGDSYEYTASFTLVGSVPPGGLVSTWSSDNPAVASITTDGMLTAKATGTATITVAGYGKSASTSITIFPKPAAPPPTITGITNLAILPAVGLVATGNPGTLRADVTATSPLPAGLYEWPVEWTSSNPGVISIPTTTAQYQNFQSIAEGTATITATLGGKTATSTMYVATPRSITVTPSAPAMSVGQQLTLVPVVTVTGPLPPTGFPVGYQSTSPLVATVSSTGVITALGTGTTKIWVDATKVSTSVIATVTGPGLTVNVNAPATTKGTATQTSAGYSVACSFVWSADASGSGVARWGKWLTSVDGVNFVDMGYNGFRGDVLAAGATLIGMGQTASGPVTPTAASWTMTMRFNYAVNASNLDSTLSGLFAPWIVVNTIEKKFTCAP